MSSPFLWHTQEVDSIAHELKTDLEQGLSNREALSRLNAYGLNELPGPKSIPWARIIVRLVISLMIPILALALVILLRLNQPKNAALILGISIVAIALSSLQQIRSEKTRLYLRKLANSSMHAKVFRSGHINTIKSTELVPGDIIRFETGDWIAADGRIIEARQLSVDESAFTEAADPVEKDAAVLSGDVTSLPIQERKNMIFRGTTVASGNGRAIVTATGIETQAAQMLLEQSEDEESPQEADLEESLAGKGLWLTGACIVISILLWAVIKLVFNRSWGNSAMISVIFLMAAWPMGLIESAVMSLIIGMKRLSKERQAIIRRFSGAEALASATAICSEKTGIMTENQMTVKRVFVDGSIMSVEGDGYDPESGGFPPNAEEDNPDLPLLLTVASLCNDTEVKNTGEGWQIKGDTTEGALIIAAMKGGISKDELGLSLTKLGEIPFDPERKRMSAVFRAPKDELFVFTKGSIDTVLDICDSIQLYGYREDLDSGKQDAIWAVNRSFAGECMKSVAFAYRRLDHELEEYSVETVERDLVFTGMMGIADPLREDAESAVRKCLDGGVQPIMVTDDNADTAFAFARSLGIATDASQMVTGADLDIMGERDYSNSAEVFSVYADISPDQKPRIVRALRDNGETVAVVSGSSSDAPALEEADVGIATGKTGSSAAINAADIVLMDDNFTTAVDVIVGMRSSYGNVKKIVRFFLSGSVAMTCTILVAFLIDVFWEEDIFASFSLFHILWINLLGISIPAIAFAFNPVTDDVIKEGPHPRGSLLDDRFESEILIRGVLTAFLAIIAFAFCLGSPARWEDNQSSAVTAAVATLIVSQIAFAFQCRSIPDEGFFRKFLANKLLLVIAFLVLLIQLLAIYAPVRGILGMEPLSLVQWIPILAAFAVNLIPLGRLFVANVEGENEDQVEESDELTD